MINILKGDFFQNVSRVGSGVIIAQVIGLAVYPILSRIYTPEEIGIYTLYSSAVILGSIIICGTYEFAIPLSKNDQQAKKLFTFTCVIAVFFSVFIFLLLSIFSPGLSTTFAVDKYIILIIPAGILLHAFLTIKTQIYTYNKSFGYFSISKITQTTTLSVTQIALGLLHFNALGLIVGHLAGRVGFLSIRFKALIKKLKPFELTFKETARKYSSYPFFVLPSSLINALSKELPVFLILPFFGDQILGQYALAYKVLITPVLLISTSVDSVFFQNIGKAIADRKKVQQKLLKTWGTLFIVGIVPFSLLYIWAEPVFSFVFGERWEFAGKTASILSFMLFMRFIFLPTAKSMLALNKQKWMPLFSSLSLIITVLSLYYGYSINDFIQALIFLSAGQGFLYLFQMLFIYFSAKEYEHSIS